MFSDKIRGETVKVRVHMMIQDPLTARYKEIRPVEGFDITKEEFFLDGPVTERVAVLDFNPETGVLLSGVSFIPAPPDRKLGGYGTTLNSNVHTNEFIQVNVFATIIKTMYMFEKEEDGLGRKLSWAFNSPQLLVIPRAGEWANAFYQRDSHSIQLFYFPDPHFGGESIYTCLSRDIISHEAGHAILDGIAPDLYNAITPQSLALHEAIADITALLMACESHTLRKAVLDYTGGSIENSTAFSAIGEEFGYKLDPENHASCLRSLLNENNLIEGDPNCVNRYHPHELSTVLSGALYRIMINMHEKYKDKYADGDDNKRFSVSGKALATAVMRFKSIFLRALDYLPRGEVSFADYGRAIIATDRISHGSSTQERAWIEEEFVRRRMVLKKDALSVKTNFTHHALDKVDIKTLTESDWAAYDFANKNRKLLGIPRKTSFKVLPRLDVKKQYLRDGKKTYVRECIFKVSWDQIEDNQMGSVFPDCRRITVGTTMVIDSDTKEIRLIITSDHSKNNEESNEQKADRNKMLRYLFDEDLLRMGSHAYGPNNKPLDSVVNAQSTHGCLRVQNTARMLYLTRRG